VHAAAVASTTPQLADLLYYFEGLEDPELVYMGMSRGEMVFGNILTHAR
jgi:hypothetical protein